MVEMIYFCGVFESYFGSVTCVVTDCFFSIFSSLFYIIHIHFIITRTVYSQQIAFETSSLASSITEDSKESK
jgi:hypothetical protein